MFERIKSPADMMHHKLAVAMKMEHTNLGMLGKNAEESHDEQVAQLLRHHQEETRGHIDRLNKAFGAFGWEPDEDMHLVIEAQDKESMAEVKTTEDRLVDNVILQGAAATEHHEIAVYEGLIINTRAMGRDDVAQLLQQNLQEEQHTLDEVRGSLQRVAMATVGQTA
jgi:ferritin-like metal-binding protein YciE